MASESSQIIASCFFQPGAVAPAPNTFGNVGIKSITRLAGVPTGGWLVELDRTINNKRAIITVQTYGDTSTNGAVKEQAGSTKLEIRTFDAANALADLDFWLKVEESIAALREDQRL